MNANIENSGDMGAAIAKMLEDPESLGRIMSLAGTLSSSGILSGLGQSDSAFENKGENQEENRNFTPKESEKSEKTRSYEREGDTRKPQRVRTCDRIRLLEAMRPFLSDARRDKLELVIKIIGLADVAGGLYGRK